MASISETSEAVVDKFTSDLKYSAVNMEYVKNPDSHTKSWWFASQSPHAVAPSLNNQHMRNCSLADLIAGAATFVMDKSLAAAIGVSIRNNDFQKQLKGLLEEWGGVIISPTYVESKQQNFIGSKHRTFHATQIVGFGSTVENAIAMSRTPTLTNPRKDQPSFGCIPARAPGRLVGGKCLPASDFVHLYVWVTK